MFKKDIILRVNALNDISVRCMLRNVFKFNQNRVCFLNRLLEIKRKNKEIKE